ncbi:MAG: SGNH/GDSL hydrolase family protein [Planctomycetota bacterium]|nr:SGNH/GDSL hydrolase family protein [Planctomycetota bacterium]MDG1984187.1 SGNH/GDSL hydrolase family protein [Planctomycetota bacterium]
MNIARRDLLAAGLGAAVLGTRPAEARSPAVPQEPKPAAPAPDGWVRHEAHELGLEGRGWEDVAAPYHRLPARAQELVRDPVWRLSTQTSGMFITFNAATPALRFEVDLSEARLALPHMPATGVSGIDLYAREGDGPWRWAFCPRPSSQSYAAEVKGLSPIPLTYRLYLPLYNGATSVRVAVPEGVELTPIAPRETPPLVYYGTSIAHGACASRPGMSFVNILGRRLDTPILNLGFSGNGRLELELAALLGELDARAFVLDCLPNLSPKLVAERTEPFVRALREVRPDTPIVMVEDRVNANARFLPGRARHHESNHAAFRAAHGNLVRAGIGGLTYVPDAPFLGEDGEATVDGSHPTDLGMVRYADALEPILRPFL